MREPSYLNTRHTNLMYSIAEYVDREVTAPREISDDVFANFLLDHNIDDVHARIARPCQRTLLHSFIANLSNNAYGYVIRKAAELECETFRILISHVRQQVPPWLNKDEVCNHKEELAELCQAAIAYITPTVFHLLFSDRNLLFKFQQRVAIYVRTLQARQHPQFLRCDGVVQRLTYLPAWLQRAVYFRDQGRCQLCCCEISGLNSPNILVHLDHMVPLAAGGSNDPTNFQLTCGSCNTSKGKQVLIAPAKFEPYW